MALNIFASRIRRIDGRAMAPSEIIFQSRSKLAQIKVSTERANIGGRFMGKPKSSTVFGALLCVVLGCRCAFAQGADCPRDEIARVKIGQFKPLPPTEIEF